MKKLLLAPALCAAGAAFAVSGPAAQAPAAAPAQSVQSDVLAAGTIAHASSSSSLTSTGSRDATHSVSHDVTKTSRAKSYDYLAWPKNTVYVVDKTNSSWQVARGIEGADNHSALNLVRVTKCPAKATQCVPMTLGSLPGNVVGRTDWSYDSATGEIVSAKVVLDKDWGKKTSAHNRRTDVCHEVLHSVGMEHVNDKGSCLNPYVDDRVSDKASKANEALLRKMYR